MNCPNYNRDDNKVLDKRNKDSHNYRRRLCNICGIRFSTSEVVVERNQRKKVIK